MTVALGFVASMSTTMLSETRSAGNLVGVGVVPDSLREAGYRVTKHRSGALGISEKDAFGFSQRQAMLSEQHERRHYELMVAQQARPVTVALPKSPPTTR